ncbi:MAG TPA: aminoglycoside phosphotransferase family protein [Ktedonobacteraceae bacterium]|nr:aminoglycoside phosphotransferase family protein [Ktedonobacteraceae bacterium]
MPRIQHIVPCGEPSAWSCVYRLEGVDGTRLFVKGTPRTRPEALVTAHLTQLCPNYLPPILHSDLVPTSTWRWFVLADAGSSLYSPLSHVQAQQIARTLGRVQRVAENDQILPQMLPRCEAMHLVVRLFEVCHWAMEERARLSQEAKVELHELTRRIVSAQAFFSHIARSLTDLPATIVHGDLWQGNLAQTKQGICLLDWGDALWGIGGVSLAHWLLADKLVNSSAIWEAYAQGLGRTIRPAYRAACLMALDIIDLVIDQAIAKSCGMSPACLPGLLPALRRVDAQSRVPLADASI